MKKKIFKSPMDALLILLAIVIILLSINNNLRLKRENNKIIPYGQAVKVGKKEMRVSISGKGDKTLVLMSGYLTASPVIDFLPLTKELEKNYKVVVIEPLGYGLSDDTRKKRKVENLSKEMHTALESLNIKKYTLVGHSIAGVYALDYIDRYQNEVEGFIGIDSSVPSLEGSDNNREKALRFAARTGLYRAASHADEDILRYPPVDEKLKKQFKYISMRDMGARARKSEGKLMEKNFEKVENIQYKKDFPVLFILSKETIKEYSNWIEVHEDMIKDLKKGKLVVYDGPHYLHHTKAKEITSEIKDFITY
ncbi:MAG: alpha/beta hydrolase [Erysipelotrichales bacterium]